MAEIKRAVTISRLWNNPEIEIVVTTEGMSLKIDMEDFKEAVKREMLGDRIAFKQAVKLTQRLKYLFNGDVLTDIFMSTKTGLASNFEKAVNKVLEGVKQESKKVV